MKIKISIDTKSKEEIIRLKNLADYLLSQLSDSGTVTVTTKGSTLLTSLDEDRPGGGPRG